MKILYSVLCSANKSLATLDVFTPMEALAARGHEVTIACVADGRPSSREVGKGRIAIRPIFPSTIVGKPFLGALQQILLSGQLLGKLVALTRDLEPDVLICSNEFMLPLISYSVSKVSGLPHIVIHREALFESIFFLNYSPFRHARVFRCLTFPLFRLNLLVFERSAKSIAIHSSIYAFVKRFIKHVNVDLVNLLCLDLNEIEPFRKPDILSSASNVVYSGALDPDRQVHLLINAFQLIAPQYPNTKLTISGTGRDPDAFQSVLKLAQSRLGGTNIIFVGFVPRKDLLMLLATATICVDTYPKVAWTPSGKLLEGMAFGASCIGADVIANRFMIEEGQTGVLFRSGNAADLASKLSLLLSSPELRTYLGGNARKRIEERHDSRIVAANLERLLISTVTSWHSARWRNGQSREWRIDGASISQIPGGGA